MDIYGVSEETRQVISELDEFLYDDDMDEHDIQEDHHEIGRQEETVYIDNDLLNLATRHLHSPEESSGPMSWKYNWQTKERMLPEPLKEASKATTLVEKCLENLIETVDILKKIPNELKPPTLLDVQRILVHFLDNKEMMSRQLEGIVNALRFYWFPESVDHMKKGAYKTVRLPTKEKLQISEAQATQLHCVLCTEHMDGQKVIPVLLRRRCEAIPFLKLKCDGHHCSCRLPSVCLNCTLEHVLKNGFRERKSSVFCPTCRGEFCIYDIQEVTLQVTEDDIEKLKKAHEKEKEALLMEIEKLKNSVLFYVKQNDNLHQ